MLNKTQLRLGKNLVLAGSFAVSSMASKGHKLS